MLTQQDLIEMKQKKGIASTASSAQKSVANKHEKRYMILTFDGEFEKVHYPLPLAYCEEPDIQSMFTTFQRLQGHIVMN